MERAIVEMIVQMYVTLVRENFWKLVLRITTTDASISRFDETITAISRNLLLPSNLIDFNCPPHAHDSTKLKIVVQLYLGVEYFKC